MNDGIHNAAITDWALRLDRGFALCLWLFVEYGSGGSGQGFGGWIIGGASGSKAGEHLNQPNYAGEYITRVMSACGVEECSKIPGKNIRVKIEGGLIKGIGHITRDDRWFYPADMFAAFGKEAPHAHR